MEKLVLLSVFLFSFLWLVSKDRVYIVPFILLIFSNINGLLSWEDFAAVGIVKFPDYGLIVTATFLFIFAMGRGGALINHQSILEKWVVVYFIYLVFIFFYSILIQGGLEWPIKMGRRFFYGAVFFVVIAVAYKDSIAKFEKIFEFLLILNVAFAFLYIGYNFFGLDVYAEEAYEEFSTDSELGSVRRSFAGYPFMASYFAIHCWLQFLVVKKRKILNVGLFLLFFACAVAMLTRGLILALVAVIMLSPFMRASPRDVAVRMVFLLFTASGIAIFMMNSDNAYLAVLFERFSEIASDGLSGANNAQVRQGEFDQICSSVIGFNPAFGFGFTKVDLLGFRSFSQLHAGSADNAYSNILGTQGIVGVFMYFVVIVVWLITNLRLRLLRKENRSLTHFLFIIFILIINMNGANYSYLYALALPLCYDALVFLQLSKEKISVKKFRLVG